MSEQESLGQEARDAFHAKLREIYPAGYRAEIHTDSPAGMGAWEAGAQAIAARIRAESAAEIATLKEDRKALLQCIEAERRNPPRAGRIRGETIEAAASMLDGARDNLKAQGNTEAASDFSLAATMVRALGALNKEQASS